MALVSASVRGLMSVAYYLQQQLCHMRLVPTPFLLSSCTPLSLP